MKIGIKQIIIIGFLSMASYATVYAASDDEESGLLLSRDIFELEYAGNPQVSPDGRQIVYERISMDIITDRPRSNLWIINTDGSGHRPLLSGRQSYNSPRWSPDGSRIAYISGMEGSPQLYIRWMDTGQTALLSNLTEAPGDIAWSPDGKWIAFSMQVVKEKEPLAKAPAKPDEAEWAPPVKVIDTLVYRVDGEGFLEAGYSHLFVISTDGGTPRQLTSGDFNHNGPLTWTPDGRHIVFSANRNEDWEYQPLESDIYTVDVDSGELKRLTLRTGPDESPVISPDGRHIAFLGFDDKLQGYQISRLHVMNLDGSNVRVLLDGLDRSIFDPSWAGNDTLYYLYDDRGDRKLGRTSLTGRSTLVTTNIGGTSLGRPYTSGTFTVARDGTYAITINDSSHPADVAVGQGRRAARRLTWLNADLLDHKKLAGVREITWESSVDSREIQGWVMTPPGFDKNRKYPLILEIHGGPFAAYGPNFSAELQRYAAAGYVVLYCNPRGSTSYGEEFGNLIHHAYPGDDYHDLMSGIDTILKEGYVDPENLFVTGGSGGGVLTAWIVGNTDRFRAAVVAKPVINWTSFTLTSDFVNYFYKYWFLMPPWEAPDAYWKRSPLSLAGKVVTPTMLLTGEADYRTPISESEQFYVALKLRKIDTALVRIPEAPHGIAGRPSNMIAKIDNILAWFEKYRINKPDQ